VQSPKPQSFRLNELFHRNGKQTISIQRLSWKNCFIYCSVPLTSLQFKTGEKLLLPTRVFFFSDRMDIFWLSVFVKLFKRKVKFRHNRLHAQPYNIYYYVRLHMCRAHTRVCGPYKIDFSFCIVYTNNAYNFIISIHSESSPRILLRVICTYVCYIGIWD